MDVVHVVVCKMSEICEEQEHGDVAVDAYMCVGIMP